MGILEGLRQRYAEKRYGHWTTARDMDNYMEMFHLDRVASSPERGFMLFRTCGNFEDNSTFGIKISYRNGRTTRESSWIVLIYIRQHFGDFYDCPVYHCDITKDYLTEFVVEITTAEFEDQRRKVSFKCRSGEFYTILKKIRELLDEATTVLIGKLPSSPFFPEPSEERMTEYTQLAKSLVEDITASISNIGLEPLEEKKDDKSTD